MLKFFKTCDRRNFDNFSPEIMDHLDTLKRLAKKKPKQAVEDKAKDCLRLVLQSEAYYTYMLGDIGEETNSSFIFPTFEEIGINADTRAILNTKLKQVYDQSTQMATEAEEKLKQTEQDLAETKLKLEKVKKKLPDSYENCEEMEEKLDRANEKLKETEEKLQEEIQEIKGKLEKRQTKLNNTKEKLALSEEKVTKLEQKLAVTQTKHQKEREELEKHFETKLNSLKKSKSEVNTELTLTLNNLEEVTSERNKLQKQIVSLRNDLKEETKQKTLLKQADKKRREKEKIAFEGVAGKYEGKYLCNKCENAMDKELTHFSYEKKTQGGEDSCDFCGKKCSGYLDGLKFFDFKLKD